MSTVIEKYNRRVDQIDSLVCVGLDSEFYQLLPERFKADEFPQFAFNRWIIEQTHPYASAYKPNIAFYEARGEEGLIALARTMDYLRAHSPRHPDDLRRQARRHRLDQPGLRRSDFRPAGLRRGDAQPLPGPRGAGAVPGARR